MLRNAIKKLLEGKHYNIKSFAERSSEHSIERIRQVFDQLEDEGIVSNIYGDYYVLGDLSDDEEAEAINKIRRISAKLWSESDDKTEVEISGELVEDTEIETDRDPTELL